MAVKRRYKRQIRRASRRHGVNARHLAGLTEVESGFNRHAVSSAGARWLTQFMPATAESYDVRGGSTNSQFEGAAKYLSDLGYKKGDKGAIKLALASYNAGPGNPSAAGDYPQKVLAASRKYKGIGRGPGGGGGRPKKKGGRSPGLTATYKRSTKRIPGVDNSEMRDQLKLEYLQRRDEDPDALLNLASGLKEARDIPGERVTTTRRETVPGGRRAGAGGGGGGGKSGLPNRPNITAFGIGKLAQRHGLTVREHPAFDPVDPVHTQGSYHYQRGKKGGRAVDVSGDPAALARFYRAVTRKYGKRLSEAFYDPAGYYVKHGQRQKGAIGGHDGHAHFAI